MTRKIFLAAAIFLLAVISGYAVGLVQAQRLSNYGAALLGLANGDGKDSVPAYHAEPPTGPLPATLDPKQFSNAQDQNIYALAAEERDVLYQQPCYCHCDRNHGHKSLLDCFVVRHGSLCDLCKKEAVYSYQQTKAGKTPGQIREDIIGGKWKEVELKKYNTPGTAK
jgi:Protein of unknown function with PCYCGC motif